MSRTGAGWRFWLITLAAAVGIATTASLGAWQLSRAAGKEALQAQIDAQRRLPPLEADALQKGAPMHRAVLVRGHGVYVWGRDWVSAKTQAECYDYLFGAAVRLHQLGLDPGQLDRHLNPPAKKE